jgi:hypothetical protein
MRIMEKKRKMKESVERYVSARAFGRGAEG